MINGFFFWMVSSCFTLTCDRSQTYINILCCVSVRRTLKNGLSDEEKKHLAAYIKGYWTTELKGLCIKSVICGGNCNWTAHLYDPLVWAGGTCDITQPLRIHKHNTLLSLHCQGRNMLYMYSKSTIKGTIYIYI